MYPTQLLSFWAGSSLILLVVAQPIWADGVELAALNEEKAQLLLGIAEREARVARAAPGVSQERALATASEVYEKFPLTRAAAGARTLAISILLYGGRLERIEDFDRQPADAPAKALALLRQLQKRGKIQRAGLDEALLDIAWYYRYKKDYEQSEPLLLEIVRDYAHTPSAATAMLRLAEVCAAKEDRAKEEDWLLQAAESKSRDELRERHVRIEANFRLARLYEETGQWESALRHWQAYQPSSGCGTCLRSMQAKRAEHIARCHAHLGEHGAVIQFAQDPVRAWGGVGLAIAALIVTLCWLRRVDCREHRAVLWAALLTTLYILIFDVLIWAAHWWIGREPPAYLVFIALTVAAGLPSAALTLEGYRWLASHLRRPLPAFSAVTAVLVLGVAAVDCSQQFHRASAYGIWNDVVLTLVVLWVPVVLYEGIRHWRDVPRDAPFVNGVSATL